MADNRVDSMTYLQRASKLGPLGIALCLQFLIILLATFVIVLVPESPALCLAPKGHLSTAC